MLCVNKRSASAVNSGSSFSWLLILEASLNGEDTWLGSKELPRNDVSIAEVDGVIAGTSSVIVPIIARISSTAGLGKPAPTRSWSESNLNDLNVMHELSIMPLRRSRCKVVRSIFAKTLKRAITL